jgi:MYXO-CTERM domain-containing protein
LALPSPAVAAPVCGDLPDLMIVFDRSSSMSSKLSLYSSSKWSIAKNALKQLVQTFAGKMRFGLAIFPGLSSECDSPKLDIAMGSGDLASFTAKLGSTGPKGATPIEKGLKFAYSYLKTIPTPSKHVLLITDGIETCGGDADEYAKKLLASGIKTYVVGFGSGVNKNELEGIAKDGGTSNYFQADSPAALTSALQAIAGQVSCCGNGILDGGEACDTAIAAGKTGACPTTCDDGDPCTVDAPKGNDCAASCSHSPVTAFQAGDGCCPPGGTQAKDGDCPASCGDGVVSAGETCDIAVPSGPGSCSLLCDDGDPCTTDALSGAGCNVTCTHDAVAPNALQKDGCCPSSAPPTSDVDCLPPCDPDSNNTKCVDPCQAVNCPDGHICKFGQCTPWEPIAQEPAEPTADPVDPRLGTIEAGCACTLAGSSAGSNPLLLLLGLLALGLLWRARR